MKAPPFGGEQLVVDRLAEERVAECIARAPASSPVGHEELRGHGLVDGCDEGSVVHVEHGREQLVVDRDRRPPTRPRAVGRRARTRFRCGRAARRLRRSGRAGRPVASPAARSSSAKNGLPSDRRAMRSTSAGAAELPWIAASWSASSPRSKRSSQDVLDARQALHLGEPRSERMAAMELVGAIRADDEDPLVTETAREEGEEVAGRAVGPMQVLDDEHDRAALPETFQEGEEAVEQPCLGPLRPVRRPPVPPCPAR